MKEITVKVSERNEIGTKSARRMRNTGFVPGVVYGKQKEKKLPLHVTLSIEEVRKIVSHPTSLIEINTGQNSYKAILQEKQIHPVSGTPLHLDFLAVSPGQVIKMDIPIKLIGKSVGVEKGGMMVQKMRKIRTKAIMEEMPENIEADVSHVDLGKTIRLKEIKMENCEFLGAPNLPVGTVEIPRSMRSGKKEESTAEGEK